MIRTLLILLTGMLQCPTDLDDPPLGCYEMWAFKICQEHPGLERPGVTCLHWFDTDGDRDIDLEDWAEFQNNFEPLEAP